MTADMLHAMPLDLVMDHLGTRLNAPRAGVTRIVVNWEFPDTRELASSILSHGALTAIMSKRAGNADATVTVPRAVFERVVMGQATIADVIQRGDAAVSGNAGPVVQLFGLFDDFDAAFPIVEPRM